MRVACGLKLRTYLYLLSGGLEAEHDTMTGGAADPEEHLA